MNSPWHQLKIQSKIYPRSLWDLRRLRGIFSSEHPRSYQNFLIISQESSLILGNECVSDSGKTFLEDPDRTSALMSLDLLRFLGELARSKQNFCQNLPRKSSQNLRRIRFQDSGKILGRWSENSHMIWDDLMIKSLIIFQDLTKILGRFLTGYSRPEKRHLGNRRGCGQSAAWPQATCAPAGQGGSHGWAESWCSEALYEDSLGQNNNNLDYDDGWYHRVKIGCSRGALDLFLQGSGETIF